MVSAHQPCCLQDRSGAKDLDRVCRMKSCLLEPLKGLAEQGRKCDALPKKNVVDFLLRFTWKIVTEKIPGIVGIEHTFLEYDLLASRCPPY